MRFFRFVFLSCLLPIASVAAAVDVPSKIEAVTVYMEGAMVTRVSRINLSAGSNEIRLTGLVDSIEVASLQAEVASDAVQIGQINLTSEKQRDAIDSEVVALRSRVDETQRSLQVIDASSNAAKLRLKFLEGIAAGYAKESWFEGTRGTADIASWRAALDLLQSGSEDAHGLIRQNEAKKTEVNKDLSLLIRQLAALRGKTKASSSVELTLDARQSTTTELRLHYYQEDAEWAPRYEARLDSNNGNLQLLQVADIEQQSDEDWSAVKLTLSTSAPEGELIAPELDSEFLDLVEPAPRRKTLMRQSAVMSNDANGFAEEIVVTGSRVRADVGGFAVRYAVPGSSTVTNDADEPVTVELAKFNFDTELVTQVVPRESTQAFLAARFIYNQSVPLFGSSMAVFVDGVYAGESEMPSALPQSEVVLPMGQDRRVEVHSQSQGGADGNAGIISKRKTETTDYLFEIINRRDSASHIEVQDLYPVARNKSIEVEVPRTATAPTERDLDDKPGLVVWKKTLGAGESWRINHQYTISYPAKSILRKN